MNSASASESSFSLVGIATVALMMVAACGHYYFELRDPDSEENAAEAEDDGNETNKQK